MQSRPYLQATEPVHPPDAEQRDEASIYLELAQACGSPLFGSRIAQTLLQLSRRFDRRRRSGEGGLPGLPQERILSLLLRLGASGQLRRSSSRRPHGRERPRAEGGGFLGGRIVTDDKKVDLSPPALLAATNGTRGSLRAGALARTGCA